MTELKPFKALIFDMDGTIVDNMAFHDRSWKAWHAELGLPFDEARFTIDTAGRSLNEIVSALFPALSADEVQALGSRKEALYREMYRPHVAALPGLLPLMDAAQARGIPMAVGSAAPFENIALVLDGLAIRNRFGAIKSPGNGLRGKPNPDIFLAAAEALGVAPEACVVFEDAPLGVEAATRAGMASVALTTMVGANAFADFPNCLGAVRDFTMLSALKRWPGLA